MRRIGWSPDTADTAPAFPLRWCCGSLRGGSQHDDPKLLWFHSTERKSVYVEGQNFVPDAEGYVAVPENLGQIQPAGSNILIGQHVRKIHADRDE